MLNQIVLSRESTLSDLVRLGVTPYFAGCAPYGCLPALPDGLKDFQNVDSVGLEFRLGQTNGPVDLAWAHRIAEIKIPNKLCTATPWQGVAAVREAWRAGDSDLGCANSVMFEIDQDGSCFDVNPAVFFTHNPMENLAALAFLRCTRRILGYEGSAGVDQTVTDAIGALPPSASVVGHGYMLSRPCSPVRLMVTNMSSVEIICGFLENLNWPGNISLLEDKLKRLPRSMKTCDLALSIDVADGIGARVGIELILHGGARDPLVQIVLDELIASGLCLAELRRIFENWTAMDDIGSSALSAFASITSVRHRISHVKIAFHDSNVEAKGYLECYLPRNKMGGGTEPASMSKAE